MAENLAPGTGGLHPGKPVIWPTSKQSQQQVSSSQQSQTSGGVRNISTSTTQQTAQAASTSAAAQTATTAAAAPATANVARAMTLEDIGSHLASLQIANTDTNMRMAQLMLKYGVELSRGNFVKLMQMMQGTNMSPAIQEAAIALLMKGIDSPEALKILSNYFQQDPNLAAQLIALQQSLGSLQGTLGAGRAALSSSLLSQISAMLTQFDELLKGLPGKYKFTGDGSVDREALLNEVRAMKGFLEGVQEKAPIDQGGASEVLSASLSAAINKLDSVLQNLVTQAIMSQGSDRQEVNYQFYQIPNSLAIPPKNFEIIIKKDSNEHKTIDPADTQVIMSIDTHNMGKVSIIMRVRDKKVNMLFNTENAEAQNLFLKESGDLMKKLLDKDYIAEGFQVKVNSTMCNIRPYLIPMIGLDDLTKINVEA